MSYAAEYPEKTAIFFIHFQISYQGSVECRTLFQGDFKNIKILL